MSHPIKVIAYCRVSTPTQAAQSDSITAQMLAIEQFCLARDYTLIGAEDDRGVSGALAFDKRPALSRAISRIDHGEANALAFYRLDRLSRSVEHTLSIFAWAHRRRVDLLSVVEHLDTTTPWGRFNLHMMAAQSELQRALLGESVKASLSSIQSSGFCVGRYAPFGYRLGSADGSWEMPRRVRDADGRATGGSQRIKLVPNEYEMVVRQEIVSMFESGMGSKEVLEALRRQHVPYPRGVGWTTAMVKAIYKGGRHP